MANGQNVPSKKLEDLVSDILSTQIPTEEKIDLINEVRKLKPGLEDSWLYRWIIWFLGSISLATVVLGFAYVTYVGNGNLPDGLVALGSAAIGALGGLLAKPANE